MPGRLLIVCLAGACLLAGGCRLPAGDASKDPLLASRTPIQGSSKPAAPTLLASAEPVPPAFPATILAAHLPKPFHTSRALAVQTVSAQKQPIPAIPAVRSTLADAPQDHAFGHSPDHACLQGVLERHHLGYFHLCYQLATPDAPWQAKVRLENDPRLARFHDGELVRVEGGLISAIEPFGRESGGDYPLYRLREIERIPQP